MGQSLKEALLGQLSLLQERGLAPEEMPSEDETPSIVIEAAPRGRQTRGRRESLESLLEGDELALDLNSQFDRERRRAVPRKDHVGDEGRGDRRRPKARRPRAEGELEPPAPLTTFGGPRADQTGGPPRRPGPRPMGPGGPGVGARFPDSRPVGRTEIMQRRAEQRQREDQEVAEMRQLLGEFGSSEMDDAAMEEFSRALAQETGALPPPRIVLDAIKEVRTADPVRIGDAVRAYYRRPRMRPSSAPAVASAVAAGG